VPADVAVCTREAVCEDAALQIRAQLGFDVAWQPAVVAVASVGEEAFQVPAHELVQNGLSGTTGCIGGREPGHGWACMGGDVPCFTREIPTACES
jgi:hypothetical protein